MKRIGLLTEDPRTYFEMLEVLRERGLEYVSLDFDDAVIKNSDDKESAAKGGDLGYIVRGMLPKELEEPAFSLPLGQPSGPVQTQFGYHLIRVDEKRIAQKLKFEQVSDDLEQLLAQSNFAKELANYLKALRKDAKIQVFK